MARLKVKKMLSALPSNATRMVIAPVAGANPARTLTAPVLLDAWGHPMIYVPARVNNAQNPSSTGVLANVYVSGQSQPVSISAPDGRGFWVSVTLNCAPSPVITPVSPICPPDSA